MNFENYLRNDFLFLKQKGIFFMCLYGVILGLQFKVVTDALDSQFINWENLNVEGRFEGGFEV
jgi:hypothetical protein